MWTEGLPHLYNIITSRSSTNNFYHYIGFSNSNLMGVILYDNIASFAVASPVLLIVWFMLSNTTKIMPEEDNETKLRSEEVNDRSQNMSTQHRRSRR